MQPHAKPSGCLHAKSGLQVCKHPLRVLAEFLRGPGTPADGHDGSSFSLSETRFELIFIKHFLFGMAFTHLRPSHNPVT